MRAVLLSTEETHGGAARAANRLHQALLADGVDSRLLVGHKTSEQSTVQVISPAVPRAGGFDRIPAIAYRNRRGMFSANFVPDRVAPQVAKLNPDIVNLHWVGNGFLRVESLAKLPGPVVWTLHDMWAFTGGCHYTAGCRRFEKECGRCPVLGSDRERDLSRAVHNRKQNSWTRENLTIVTPSHWMAREAASASLFRDRRVEVIANGLDTEVYRPVDRTAARKAFGLPIDRPMILAGSLGFSTTGRKGLGLLLDALGKLSTDCDVAVFGAEQADFGTRQQLHFLGRIDDEAHLAAAYSMADVFVAPSREDNLPNTVVESLACGTPVAAFEIGGMPDMIRHQDNGFLAPPFDTTALAGGIDWLLADDGRLAQAGESARTGARSAYSLDATATGYRSLFEELLTA